MHEPRRGWRWISSGRETNPRITYANGRAFRHAKLRSPSRIRACPAISPIHSGHGHQLGLDVGWWMDQWLEIGIISSLCSLLHNTPFIFYPFEECDSIFFSNRLIAKSGCRVVFFSQCDSIFYSFVFSNYIKELKFRAQLLSYEYFVQLY